MKSYLDFYIVKIREKGQTEDFYPLDNIEGIGFIELFNEYHEWLRINPLNDEGSEKLLNYHSAPIHEYEEEDNFIFGYSKLDVGRYGYTSDIKNRFTGDLAFTQQPDHASTYPLFLGLHYRSGMESGIVALQQDGPFAMKSQFLKSFTNFLNEEHDRLFFTMNSYIPEEVIKAMLAGATLKKLRFVKYNASRDAADNLGFSPDELEALLQFKIKGADDGKVREFLGTFVRNVNRNRANYIELHNFEYDSFDIVTEINGQQKTISSERIGDIRGTIIIDDDIERDEENHVTFESIKGIARRNIIDFAAELVH